MDVTETRIDLVQFACPNCTCGSCVSDSLKEIEGLDGVVHVRVDRRRTQIVVRHETDTVAVSEILNVVSTKGILLRT